MWARVVGSRDVLCFCQSSLSPTDHSFIEDSLEGASFQSTLFAPWKESGHKVDYFVIPSCTPVFSKLYRGCAWDGNAQHHTGVFHIFE